MAAAASAITSIFLNRKKERRLVIESREQKLIPWSVEATV